MENLFLTIISILTGVCIARYYYRRSIIKELTPFLLSKSDILDHIDDKVKSDLSIEYRKVKVERLQQIQFLIANTGERAIEEPIKPLELEINNKVEIMDANILHIHPNGREVRLSIDKTNVKFMFPLLNKGDFFLVKFLINGGPKKSDYKFSITAADLPSKLGIQRLHYNQIEQEGTKYKKKIKFDFRDFLTGLCFFISSACIGILSHYSTEITIPEIKVVAWSWLNVIPFVLIARFVGEAVSGVLGAIGIILILEATFVVTWRPRSKKFVLPGELAKPKYSRDLEEMFDSVTEDIKEKRDLELLT